MSEPSSPEPLRAARRRPSPGALLLLALVAAGVVFRFAWAGWDEGALLHPDEYGLTGTLTRLSAPRSLGEWIDTSRSPMSPYARYDAEGRPLAGQPPDAAMRWGQWPQLLVRAAAEALSGEVRSGGTDFTAFGEMRLLGRRLSAAASALTLALLFLLARRLAGTGTALLATALAALAPLPLQQARFLTVDGFSALFATAALVPAVRIASGGGKRTERALGDAALFGVLSAMAVASRLNLAPIVLLLPAALLLRDDGVPAGVRLRRAAAPALAGALFFLAAFRLTHPMSFRAPRGETRLLTLTLNPDWLRNVELARSESSLENTSPPAEQWAGRAPVLFPALNTFLWGLGPAGGAAALAGLALCLAALRRGRARPPGALLLLAGWTVLFFLFMAARPVSSVRYFLPIFPLFALFGALALRRLGRGRAAKAATAAVLAFAFAWAWAFSETWRRPNTRIEASRYLFESLPAAATVELDGAEGEARVPLRLDATRTVGDEPVVVGLPHGAGGRLRGVAFAHVAGPAGTLLRASVRPAGGALPIAAAEAVLGGAGRHPLGDPLSLRFGAPALAPDVDWELVLEARGGAATFSRAVVLGESWDEVLPAAVDGRDPGLLDVRVLPVRGPDDATKREAILAGLAVADAVVLSSPRSLWVVPRLPRNYPLTRRYYRALFDGALGFAPAPPSPFQSPVRLGPLRVSDAAGRLAWGAPPELPREPASPFAAEEAFFVYDHAPVWVFTRKAALPRARLEELLPASLLDDAVAQTPRQAGEAPDAQMLPPARLAREASGAGRDDPPSPDGAWNRSGLRGAVGWALLLSLLGLAAFPLLSLALGRLPALAFAAARPAGLLAVGWLAWLLASLRLLPFGRGALLLAAAALAVAGAAAGWNERARLRALLAREARTLVVGEVVFLALFTAGLFLRRANPDLWQPWLGGEKPMDFAFLNAFLRTAELPPQHPWFAGGTLNYYGFGYLLAAVPARLLGIVPPVAYNLAVPTFFALAGALAFALGFSLVRRAAGRRDGRPAGEPFAAGLLSAALLLLLGNLGQLRLLLHALQRLAGGAGAGLDPGLVATGAWKALAGSPLPLRGEQLFWDATRLVPAVAGAGQEITEFPYFTWLFADLHPHAMALPLGLLVLAWALALREGVPERRPERVALLGLGALALGAVRASNPWDFPLLVLAAVAAGAAAVLGEAPRGSARRAAAWALGPLALSFLLFRPFDAAYVAPYGDVSRFTGTPTPAAAWLWLWGLPAFALASLAASEAARRLARPPAPAGGPPAFLRGRVAVGAILLLGPLAAWLLAGVPSALVAWPLAAACLAAASAGDSGPGPERRAVLLAAAVAFLVTLGIDRWAVGGDRTNTVFKLSFQAFALLAVVSGPALAWSAVALRREGRSGPRPWHAAAALLLAAAALYPLTATPARLALRFPPTTPGEGCRPFADVPAPAAGGAPVGLDGAAFLASAAVCEEGRLLPLRWDGEAFTWLRAHEKGSPAILEAVQPEYRWGSRYSVYTGLPAVVGWSWHVRQHRAAVPGTVVDRRIEEVGAFYRARWAVPGEPSGEDRRSVAEARRLLERYRVRWVVGGLLERAVYGEAAREGLEDLGRAGILEAAYRNAGVTLWRVRGR